MSATLVRVNAFVLLNAIFPFAPGVDNWVNGSSGSDGAETGGPPVTVDIERVNLSRLSGFRRLSARDRLSEFDSIASTTVVDRTATGSTLPLVRPISASIVRAWYLAPFP